MARTRPWALLTRNYNLAARPTAPGVPSQRCTRAASSSTAAPPALDAALREDVDTFADMRPHPVSVREVLDTVETWRIAKFLHTEMPIRFAERIRLLENLPGWEDIPELQRVHTKHVQAFRWLRTVERDPTLEDFSRVVKEVVEQQKEVVAQAAMGMARLRSERGDDRCGPQVVDGFLDKFLLNRIGSNVLMTQYLACADMLGKKFPPTGIIDPGCDAAGICREAADDVQAVCVENTGLMPVVNVEAYSAVGDDRGVPTFSYIPSFLQYMVGELLKNCCRATTDTVKSAAELDQRPITVVVCADEQHVVIRISDKAKGIPLDVGTQIWSYLYSTTHGQGQSPTELAGYGIGLPLSRLYARYLGGSLDLVSLPGYGTDAYVMLPRLEANQQEVVPDADQPYTFHTLSDFML